MKRKTMANLAKDMDTWIEKRDKLSHQVDDLRSQKEALLKTRVSVAFSLHLKPLPRDKCPHFC